MFTGLLHSHKLFVTLFLVHYIVKLLLLQLNKKEQLEKYTKATRIPEMIISVGFLVTGVWMMVKGSAFTTLLIVKLICVFASIPLAIIGFKRSNKALALVAVALIVAAFVLAEQNREAKAGGKMDTSSAVTPFDAGHAIYDSKCVQCHGADGKLGLDGAKDLSATLLTAEEQKQNILNGKNSMPAFNTVLADSQIDAVLEYTKSLKK